MATSAARGVTVRALVQQCLSARLQVKPASREDVDDATYVEIGRGIVIYLCFLKGADSAVVQKTVKALTSVRLSFNAETGSNGSVLDIQGDILVVPQATLGGKIKGRAVQYHGNIAKDDGQQLYDEFVSLCNKEVSESSTSGDSQHQQVHHGSYGNRQVLSIVTNGPFTHLFEF
ncbi:D-aminoacyl-tRNA deacylase 2-like [Corticium candelabrum]|uniref:D-aminoacyl-tRNA deacylase 2-like n=1 Tax=Corticium candelabrum TaxID=121492 RepID=UPI002E35370F|nr:D-aminoacyl-tRNA deacylase 2-like [Corticium candelabrum]